MLLAKIKEVFGVDMPLSADEVAKKMSLNANSVSQMFRRWCEQGEIERWGYGIYYIPKQSRFFGKKKMSTEKVIQVRYLGSDQSPIGYYSDLTLANVAGITTQMAATKTIVTNATASRRRKITVGDRSVYLKAPRKTITNFNVRAMELLDLLLIADDYSEYGREETKRLIQEFAIKNKITAAQVQDVLEFFPSKAAKALMTMEVYNVFA